ncbi:hypothetical protein BDN72DRAFT_880087 [Pluteus cervinus]|uniref:Uncharacterized protein n=1 Tax=Pluteus cervinus TaxID=181527 RepID=A0ACD3ALZ5_9AGAR|nr:hypothetical protein BDN72DRAFT_880087 [Pluteus cervinus]
MYPSPRLPPELEYVIFVLAYQDDHREAKNLVLVARRVFNWLLPHIFRIVKLSDGQPMPIRFNKSVYKKYGHHARHLMIDSSRLRGYLHLFPNVVDLAFWLDYNPADLTSLLQLPLLHMSTEPSLDLFQIFARLTHLDLWFTFKPESNEIKTVLYLPKLTHLCVISLFLNAAVRLFLSRERCPELRVVIIREPGPGADESEWVSMEGSPFVDDKRVVMIRCHTVKDWERGARGEEDMWKFAEDIIKARKPS